MQRSDPYRELWIRWSYSRRRRVSIKYNKKRGKKEEKRIKIKCEGKQEREDDNIEGEDKGIKRMKMGSWKKFIKMKRKKTCNMYVLFSGNLYP
jgi:hypothetical protein